MTEPSLPPGFTRETTIRRDARGQWFHDGQPVLHPKVKRAFDAWVDRAEDGRTILKNPVNWAYVQIEGAPVFVLRAELRPQQGWLLGLSDGRTEPLRAETLRQDSEGSLYCTVREGRLAARFTASALVELSDSLEETPEGVAFRGPDGRSWPIPGWQNPLADPLHGETQTKGTSS